MNNILIKIKAGLTKWLTEDNGSDLCLVKAMSLVAFAVFLGYALYGLIAKDHYAVSEFASGLMQVLAGCGAAIGMKNISTK